MKKLLASIGAGAFVFGAPALASAQLNLERLQTLLFPVQPTQNVNLPSLFQAIFNIIILIAAIIAILYLVWAGIQYITASTDEEKAKKARTAIYNAIIGIVVIILSYTIIVWVSNLARTTLPGTENNGVGGFNSGNTGTGTFGFP